MAKKAVKSQGRSNGGSAKKSSGAKATDKSVVNHVGVEKQYLKSRPICKVTFRLPREAAADAQSVTVAGNFNGWNSMATPMKKLKDGSFSVTVELEAGTEYHYRYFVDGCRWENDWAADRYETNPFGSDDSVVVL